MSSDTALDPDFLDEDGEDWEDRKTYKEILETLPDGWECDNGSLMRQLGFIEKISSNCPCHAGKYNGRHFV